MGFLRQLLPLNKISCLSLSAILLLLFLIFPQLMEWCKQCEMVHDILFVAFICGLFWKASLFKRLNNEWIDYLGNLASYVQEEKAEDEITPPFHKRLKCQRNIKWKSFSSPEGSDFLGPHQPCTNCPQHKSLLCKKFQEGAVAPINLTPLMSRCIQV